MPETVADALIWAKSLLIPSGVDAPRMDAELLLAKALGWPRIKVITETGCLMPHSASAQYRRLVRRRLKRVPLWYIIGEMEFFSLRFRIGPGALVPRPETELLVEEALTELNSSPAGGEFRVLDVGAGSGNVSVSIAANCPRAEVFAIEKGSKTAVLARQNAKLNGVSKRVRTINADFFGPMKGVRLNSFDLVVSNPPYVPSKGKNKLQPELGYEPSAALFAGADGLAFIRRFIPAAKAFLRPGGALMFEIGAGQSRAVRKMLESAEYSDISVRKDLNKIDRIFKARCYG